MTNDNETKRVTTMTPDSLNKRLVVTSVQKHGDRQITLSFTHLNPSESPGALETSLVMHHASMDHLLEMSIAEIDRTMPYALVPLPKPEKPNVMHVGDLGLNEDGSIAQSIPA